MPLQNQLNFIDKITNEKIFIPQNAIITNCKTITEGKKLELLRR